MPRKAAGLGAPRAVSAEIARRKRGENASARPSRASRSRDVDEHARRARIPRRLKSVSRGISSPEHPALVLSRDKWQRVGKRPPTRGVSAPGDAP